ncbi:MgtC/SapB family protein [Quadrisphaera oryzae]|uniref:MgtC/SapB family protein n=1 Tax=Quadrisphaera TaxID=317661 RepID=UPI0016465D91|nr:MgtC/SapB family protein [Quadrisphaera sp. RL12-1S]
MASSPLTDLDFALRLLTAVGCGVLIGLERQWRSRTAGLRTNALVATGACAFVLFGQLVSQTQAPLQIAAYVVSGVGFLGGGVILRQGSSVQGLNTAATLWCSAAIGCLAAAGHAAAALAVTGVVIGVHLLLRPLGRLVDRTPTSGGDEQRAYQVTVEVRRKHEGHLRAQVLQSLSGTDARLQGLTSTTSEDDASATLALLLVVDGSDTSQLNQLVERLSLEQGVRSVAWQEHRALEAAGDDAG